jgi:hypothetical protein
MAWEDLSRLLEGLLQRWGLPAQVLPYTSGFEVLWERLVNDAVPSSALLLLYDGIPRGYASPQSLDPLHFDALFSPVVWYALLAAGPAGDGDARAIPPCALADPHRRSDADDYERALKQLLAPHLYCIGEHTDLHILKGLSGTRRIASWQRKAIRRHLQTLLTEPSHRHAISNIVGPLVLGVAADELPLPQQDKRVLLYLHSVLCRLGLLGEPPEGQWPWVSEKEVNLVPDASFVLIDDMADLGWEALLRKALGLGQNDTRLVTFRSPDPILKSLLDDNGRLRLNKGLQLPGVSQATILFLDLRLFARGRPVEEFRFFDALLDAASQATHPSDLPWKRGEFTEEELRMVRRCIDQRLLEGERYYAALTLLPRLIALVDPQLPIVLFASTGQRRILEALKPYGTIITEFEKPRLFIESGPQIVAQTQIRFERAFRQAIRLLMGRITLRRLRSQTCESERRRPEAAGGIAEPYVEIYLDEASLAIRRDFVVGGVALVYEAEGVAERLNERMIQDGLVWGPSDIRERPKPRACLPKEFNDLDDLNKRVLNRVARILEELGVLPVGFCLKRGPAVPTSDSLNLASPACLDNVYRRLVLEALEVLLFEVLPCLLSEKPFRCAVYAATRIRTQPRGAGGEEWSELPRRYGVNVITPLEGGPLFFQSVRSDSVYPMVAEVLARHPESKAQVCAARGARLVYLNSDRGYSSLPHRQELPRPAHFLADIVARFGPGPCGRPLKTWLERGFVGIADERFDCLLSACRHARAGRHVDALLAAAAASKIDPWANPRVAKSLDALAGPDFVQFCERLPK